MSNKKSIFLDNGWKDFQLIFIIPVVCAYADSKGIKEIIFEKNIPANVTKDKNINQLLMSKKVSIFKKNNFFLKLFRFFGLFFILPKIIFFFCLFNFRLVKKTDWYTYQLMHAFWDISYVNSKDTDLKPSYLNRIKSIFKIFLVLDFFNDIYKNIDTAFLSHKVYTARVLLANFYKKKINIFTHSGNNIYKIGKKDNTSNFIEKSNLEKLNLYLKTKNINKYWKNVLKGRSKNLDTCLISNVKIKPYNFNYDQSLNVIFLHVFRDSSYDNIDPNRIFFGYHEWFEETLKILKESKEDWIIRTHPIMYKWGEDSNLIVEKFIKRVFNNVIPNNIKIQNRFLSNFELLNYAKRIITYSGSVHIEAACFGIKPICISETTLERVSKDFILKPKSLNHYKKLLLKPKHDNLFRLSKNKVEEAKTILFIKDNVISFSDVLKSKNIYRGSSAQEKIEEFKKNKKELKKNLQYFQQLGKLHAEGLMQSVTKSYLSIINDTSFK